MAGGFRRDARQRDRARRRELDRIVDEVSKHLMQALGVGTHGETFVLERLAAEPESLGLREREHLGDHAIERLLDRYGIAGQRHAASLDA